MDKVFRVVQVGVEFIAIIGANNKQFHEKIKVSRWDLFNRFPRIPRQFNEFLL